MPLNVPFFIALFGTIGIFICNIEFISLLNLSGEAENSKIKKKMKQMNLTIYEAGGLI